MRWFARSLVLVLAVTVLVACGSSSDSSSTTTSPAADNPGLTPTQPAASDVPAGATVTDVSTDLSKAPTAKITGTDTAPTELQTQDVVTGDGDEAKAGDTVEVQYTGWLTNDQEFDSSWATGQPIEFPLSRVIEGWGEGIPGMKVGGRRVLIIPSDLAYGPTGNRGIPPSATLIFVVDLLGVSGS